MILVTGACPGAGKTSLSSALSARLAACIPTRLLSEDDLLRLGPFARFDDELFREDRAAIHTLLAGTRAVFAGETETVATWIIDALLPGWFWLLGRYPVERVDAFSQELADVLRPFRPLTVYLTGDVEGLFARAVAQRGSDWGERMVAAIGRWQVPFYPGEQIRDREDMLRFFSWLDQGVRGQIARWPGDTLVLDASLVPLDELAKAVTEKVKL